MRVIITLSGEVPDDLNKEQIHWIRADANYWGKELMQYAHDVGIAVEFIDERSCEKMENKRLAFNRVMVLCVTFALFCIALAVV